MMAQKFRLFLKRIEVAADKVDIVIKAACVLNNFLRAVDPLYTVGADQDDGTEMEEVQVAPLARADITKGRRPTTAPKKIAAEMRETLSQYFNGIGAVPWQNARVFN
jgi:hypothetical protein